MKKLVLAFMLSVFSFAALGEVTVGQPVPAFSITGADGETVTEKTHTGKWTVLEWYNKDCPYVKKHYGSSNMQTLQKKYTDKGVKWVKVITGAKGVQGYIDPKDAKTHLKTTNSPVTNLVFDTDGKMGKTFGAKTTPHMFVIDPKGTVVYAGAIDDNDSSKASVIPKSKNYVSAALDQGLAGQAITTASTKPYGCSVKY